MTKLIKMEGYLLKWEANWTQKL